jgi:hypothetical protein
MRSLSRWIARDDRDRADWRRKVTTAVAGQKGFRVLASGLA